MCCCQVHSASAALQPVFYQVWGPCEAWNRDRTVIWNGTRAEAKAAFKLRLRQGARSSGGADCRALYLLPVLASFPVPFPVLATAAPATALAALTCRAAAAPPSTPHPAATVVRQRHLRAAAAAATSEHNPSPPRTLLLHHQADPAEWRLPRPTVCTFRRIMNRHLQSSTRHKRVVPDLLDEICMHSAATGRSDRMLGFDGGKVLQVQPADPATAWLGQSLAVSDACSFGSIAEALAAAEDGDVLQLLPGCHVTSQTRLVITKRLLIEGLGTSPEQVLLDHRANHPVFQINRACILRNFAIDMVGFCEALAIRGPGDTPAVKPYLQHITLACSGGDGITVTGRAQPLLQRCSIQARHCGMKQSDASTTTLWQCSLSGCENGLVVVGGSQAFLERCTVSQCSRDGIMALQQAQIHLLETRVRECGGPGLDLTDSASAWLRLADIGRACCGGVFLWQQASCEAIASHIAGGSSYAVLLDDAAFARGSSTSVDGPCFISTHGSPRTPELPAPCRQAAATPGQAAGDAAEPAYTDAFCHTIRGAAAASPFSSQSSLHCHMSTQAASPLVDASLCLADASAAAALFPCERGAFAADG